MGRVKTNRKIFTGAAVVAVVATLGVVQGQLDKAAAQAKQVPRFEVDPYWPKPMPKNYVFGQTIGLGISSIKRAKRSTSSGVWIDGATGRCA